jgi:hypothetical protein
MIALSYSDRHGYALGWFGVPAADYFLRVVRSLHRRTMRDWNRTRMKAVPERRAAAVAIEGWANP